MKKLLSAFAAVLLTSVMAQASIVGSWTGKLQATNIYNQVAEYDIQQNLTLENGIFTVTQKADNLTWFSEEYVVVDGVLLKNDVAVGTLSDVAFTIAHHDLTNGDFYDASFSLNADGTANFNDKISYSTGEWEAVTGILTIAPVVP